ncbi:MAG: serine hydrolase domain-containing protein [Sedimentisphaeraceae bacterium JB056]
MISFNRYFYFLISISVISATYLLAGETETKIGEIVNTEIASGSFPGAVVYIGKGEDTLFYEAFGFAVSTPFKAKMHKNMIFDIASLSKPVATASSIMVLIDQKKIDLDAKVSSYIPAFAQNGKENVKIKHLLSHTSGLPSYMSVAGLMIPDGKSNPEKVFAKICSLKNQYEAGGKCQYSCLGYITLGKIVETVSGMPLDKFAAEKLFKPLGMNDTLYNPPKELEEKIVATTVAKGVVNRGKVHDPLASKMGGVSGNAGVFTTASDLAKYCRMLMNGGCCISDDKRILSESSVKLLTSDIAYGRAYGFDVNSEAHSWIKGDCFGKSVFCHSGYTGTSIVCDPVSKVFIIILTNRVHPTDNGRTKNVRKKIADIICETYSRSTSNDG